MHLYFSLQPFQLLSPDHIFFSSSTCLLERIPLPYPNLLYVISDPTWHARHHLEAMHYTRPDVTCALSITLQVHVAGTKYRLIYYDIIFGCC